MTEAPQIRARAASRAYLDHVERTVPPARPTTLTADDLSNPLSFTDAHNGDASMIEAAVYDALTMESPGYVGAVLRSGTVTFTNADYTCTLNAKKRTISFSPSWVPNYSKEYTRSTYAPPRNIVKTLTDNGVFLTSDTEWDRYGSWQDRMEGISEMYGAAVTSRLHGGWINVTQYGGLRPIAVDHKGKISADELHHGKDRRVYLEPLKKGMGEIIGLVPRSFAAMVPLDFAVGSREPARLQRGVVAAMAALGFDATVRITKGEPVLVSAELNRSGGAYRRLVEHHKYVDPADPLTWWTGVDKVVTMVPLPLAHTAQMGALEKSVTGAKKNATTPREPSQEWSERYQKMFSAWRYFADKGWIFTPDFDQPSLLYWGPDRRLHIVIRFRRTYPQAWTGVPVYEVDADLRVAVMAFTQQPELTESKD
jgi:hypothetical protein